MERVKGIEPSYAAWEAAVLPLNYTRMAATLCCVNGLPILTPSLRQHRIRQRFPGQRRLDAVLTSGTRLLPVPRKIDTINIVMEAYAMRPLQSAAALLAALLTLSLAAPVWAGRPLNVDDANVNEAGEGQLETWFARDRGRSGVWNIGPAYSPMAGLELGATAARDRTLRINTFSVQAKLQLSKPLEAGCYYAGIVGVSRPDGQPGGSPYGTAITTCAMAPGALHLNLGASRAPGESAAAALGVAWEQDLKFATGHVEMLAEQRNKPAFNVGLRRDVAKDVQIDGSVGRSDRQTLWSVGMKFQF